MEHEEARGQEIKKLLKEDPQAAIALAVEYYTGLVWAVCGRYLTNPEDIKECVNDTFAAFYWQREKFDGAKGSLAAFLSGIARHKAISYYRKNKRQEASALPESLLSREEGLEWADDRMDLEYALDALQAEDAEIIRMKYYGGMTVQEIADSLGLPYETVKKRHQRSLGKMRLLLLAVLLLLLAGLAACAYMALQHFGVIPKYGINRSEEIPFYVLKDTVPYRDETKFLQLEGGIMSEDSLILTVYAEFWLDQDEIDSQTEEGMWKAIADKKYELFSSPALLLEDGTVYSDLRMDSETSLEPEEEGQNRIQVEYIFEPLAGLMEGEGSLPVALRLSGAELPFTFCKAEEMELDAYSYALDSQGGVLAIPELKEGRLYVELYPLNCGDYTTEPGLVRSVYEEAGGPKGEVTVTGEDGTVHVGECLSFSPFSTHAFFCWDFGPAEAGEYRLDIPYVYQTAVLPEDFRISVSDAEPGTGQNIQVPGSLLTISSYSREQPEGTKYQEAGDQENRALRRFLCFDVETEAKDRVLVGVRAEMQVVTEKMKNYFEYSSLWKQQKGYDSYLGYAIQLPEGCEAETVEIGRGERENTVAYRWNHPFSISICVKEEKQ